MDLRGYQYVVLLNWRELRSTSEQPWDRLCDALAGKGVNSVDQTIAQLRLRPLHEALREVVNQANVQLFNTIATEPPAKSFEPTPLASDAVVETIEIETVSLDDRQTDPREQGDTSETTADEETPATEPLPAPPATFDPRLEDFLAKASACFDRILDLISTEQQQAMQQNAVATNPKAVFIAALQSAAAAALRLPTLAESFSTAWPPAVVAMLPGETGDVPESIWAPVIAWTVLQSLPASGIRGSLFDSLQLRAALADIFPSIGIEGDGAWRTAARVRLLLRLADEPGLTLESASLWEDGDVRWLTGANDHEGKTYFNKEQFEELVCWLQLPALIEIAGSKKNQAPEIVLLEESVSSLCEAASAAAYSLETFLRPLGEPPAPSAEEKTEQPELQPAGEKAQP
jgi:hypothetical protein